jgi:DnaJ-domain-containing protein 1
MKILAIIITAQTILLGCANLKTVNQYSDNALKAAQKFEEIHYTFSRYCLDRCQMVAIDSFKIYREIACPCDGYKRADSVTQILYRAITGYLDGLTRLSNNQLSSYHIDRLKKAVQEEDLGVLQVKKEVADAYATLTDMMLRAFADAYRRKKIKEYITAANGPVQVLLFKLEFIESRNLKDLLEFKKERLFDHYRTLLKSRLSDYEKQEATADYYESLEGMIIVEKQLLTYARSLRAIARGHQQLYEKRNKISTEELRRGLTPYANDIRDLISEFDKLKDK